MIEVLGLRKYFTSLNESEIYKLDSRLLKSKNKDDGSNQQVYYFEYEFGNGEFPKLSTYEGYIIVQMGKNTNENGYFLLNLTNGDFVRLNYKGLEHSGLTGHVSDIGVASKAGLMDDFISSIIGYEALEKLKTMDPERIYNKCRNWFDKSTSDLLEEIEKLKKLGDVKMTHIGTMVNPQDEKVIVDLENLNPENIFVPSKECCDMFKPTYTNFDMGSYNFMNGSKYRIWFAESRSDISDEETIFVAIGNILYAFCTYEKLAWFNKLDQEVEGYETLQCNNLAFTDLKELFFNCHEDIKTEKVPYESMEEVALLLVACTNSELANKQLNFAELIFEVEDIVGVKFEYAKSRIQ